jgi:hypothetical protein
MILYNVVRVTIWTAGILVFGYILLLSQGCGSQTDKQYNCIVEGDQCELVDGDEQPVVVGPPGERGPVGATGNSGSDGVDGVAGADGESCQVTQAINGALIECADNTVLVLNGVNGIDGADGVDGQDGADGVDGIDGVDGQDGADAPPTAYTVTEIIDPCGNHSTRIDEVLLRLANGSIIASFSDNVSGLNTRFAIIGAGTYGTTDGTGCIFTVSNTGVVTW